MAICKELKPDRILMGKISHKGDLLDELTSICIEKDIKLGKIFALGAVKKANLGYYNQNTREYQHFELDNHLEITNLTGNISIKDNKPIVHAHITLADDKGNAFGGHLIKGTIIIACEFIIESFTGPEYKRGLDLETGLPLWDM